MVHVIHEGIYLLRGRVLQPAAANLTSAEIDQRLAQENLPPLSLPEISPAAALQGTMAYKILSAHNTSGNDRQLKLKFDALTSHDITYVGIVQTAAASGLQKFPVPYILTNCHNSLNAVGGTINEDDHVFGLTAARKYGGIFVPAHQAVIHQYMREMMAGGGKMILGSDSHTRYGALGTMAIGEGGGEIAKQLLSKTYDITSPEVIAIYLDGTPRPGVGPQDVALAIIKAVFASGFVKNKVMEFVGPGIDSLSVDFRNGIDVMTTETTCLTSIWRTDHKVQEYLAIHGRPGDYRQLEPEAVSYYEGAVSVNLSKIEPMIALPFHPSNAWTIAEVNENAAEILHHVEQEGRRQLAQPHLSFTLTDKIKNGRLHVEQGVVAGCAGGTFENIMAMTRILGGRALNNFPLSVYPSSQPVFLELLQKQAVESLTIAGVSMRSAFCGPCFGAGDVPANNMLSIRHTTRNFMNREGSKPDQGQISSVALMDARSIAATALNGGRLTAATELEFTEPQVSYTFNRQVYDNRVYQGFSQPQPQEELAYGPNIVPWPKMRSLPENLLLQVASVIHDAVTTTDELIPSGETSSFRSNPFKLAEFTLSRKDPAYVGRAKAVQALEAKRCQLLENSAGCLDEFLPQLRQTIHPELTAQDFWANTGLGSVIFARKPGDGSAREQAASCQRVLGADANIAWEYATKRYRSNLINWGMIPFTTASGEEAKLNIDDYLYIPGVRTAVASGATTVTAYVAGSGISLELKLENLSPGEREILLAGCLINYYAQQNAAAE